MNNNLPSFEDFKKILQASFEEQRKFIKQLNVANLDGKSVLSLQIDIGRLENCYFKDKLTQLIFNRKAKLLNPLPKETQQLEIERAKLQLQKKKIQLNSKMEQRKIVLEDEKQKFHQSNQNRKQLFSQKVEIIKLKVQFLQKICTLIAFFLVAFGSYSYLLTEPQFAVPAGDQILKGSSNIVLKIFGCIIIGVVGILIGGLTFYAVQRNNQRFWQQFDP